MAMGKPLLRVRDLRVRYAGGEGLALDGVSFDLAPSRVLGVVGESGCGKSTLACAIPRLLPASAQIEGQIAVGGEDVFSASPAALRRLRGERVGMVFQDAGAALDGAFTLGSQLRETLRLRGLSRAAGENARRGAFVAGGHRRARTAAFPVPPRAFRRAEAAGDDRAGAVRIARIAHRRRADLGAGRDRAGTDPAPARRLARAPFHGRLAHHHDLGVAAQLCDELLVLYAGRVCERGPAEAVFLDPRHGYTQALLACVPSLEGERRPARPIPARPRLADACCRAVPSPRAAPRATAICREQTPEEIPVGPGHRAALPLRKGR